MVKSTSLGFLYVIEGTWDNLLVSKNLTGNDRKWPLFKKWSFRSLRYTSGRVFTNQQIVSGPFCNILEGQRCSFYQILKILKKKIFFFDFFFWKKILKFFLFLFFDAWKCLKAFELTIFWPKMTFNKNGTSKNKIHKIQNSRKKCNKILIFCKNVNSNALRHFRLDFFTSTSCLKSLL